MKKENHIIKILCSILFLGIVVGMTTVPTWSIIGLLPDIKNMDGVTFNTLTPEAIDELMSKEDRAFLAKIIFLLSVVALFTLSPYAWSKDSLGLPAKKIKKNTIFKVIKNVDSIKNKPNLYIVYICDMYDKNDLLVTVYSQTTLNEGSFYKCIGYAENVSVIELAQAT